MSTIIEEKLQQATRILGELNIDAWLIFVRETSDGGDSVLPLALGHDLTWQSALLVHRGGERIAIVGKYDDGTVRATGCWPKVIPYVQSIQEPLLETLHRLDPATIAVNYSTDDVKSDGLSHGMYLLLQQYLSGTPLASRLISAADLISAFRGRKTPAEVARIRQAVATAEAMLAQVGDFIRPGKTEREIAAFVHQMVETAGVGFAWPKPHCPAVNTGPESMIGHGLPQDIRVEPGHIVHLDFGVRQDDYCSDLQRCWYILRTGETQPPAEVQKGFDTVAGAIQAAFAALRPGVQGWEVDAAARQFVVSAGYPEYQHGTGHHVGRSCHDGAGILGPRWPRYGSTPMRRVEAGNVFTLELGIENVGGHGYLGLEEMVLVTEEGAQWLSRPQRQLWLLQ